MQIAIVGLGIMGGSAAKALKARTDHRVIGWDQNPGVLEQALAQGVIDAVGGADTLPDTDVLLVALYPQAAIDFVRQHLARIPAKCLVVDFCGVKGPVVAALEEPCRQAGVAFIGGHPMAGREFSGFDHSLADLFVGASMILVPTAASGEGDLARAEDLFIQMGFGRVVRTTADNHDRMIAYTSQLAHVVSNAYIKSPEATSHRGYSAGSYKDLTRVARLNPGMWTELFLSNREHLARELDLLMENLAAYRDALVKGDEPELYRLLEDGSLRKQQIDRAERDDRQSAQKKASAMPVTLQVVSTPEQVARIAEVAQQVWREYYTPILGERQVAYMLENLQSAKAIAQQIREGLVYYLILKDGEAAGYTAIKPLEGRLFLSKFYVLAPYRGQGAAKAVVERFKELTRQMGLSGMFLTVNRHNGDSIAAYQKMGFVKEREQVADIGGGYVMDDDIMFWSAAR